MQPEELVLTQETPIVTTDELLPWRKPAFWIIAMPGTDMKFTFFFETTHEGPS
jgi:hypothetical protein